MTTNSSKTTTAIAEMAAITSAFPTAQAAAVDEFIARIRSTDDSVRGPGWQNAGPQGAPAVKPLAEVMTDADFEIARSAKRALYVIVRHAGRPGAAKDTRAVTDELISLLSGRPTVVRREALWLLSEIGGDAAVAPMAALLTDVELREDARCALTRLPGSRATSALKSALASAPGEFKYALADSLRARGEKVRGYPSRKLVPTRQTSVRAGAAIDALPSDTPGRTERQRRRKQ